MIQARTSSSAVSFACLKLHHAAKEHKTHKICSISESINHATHRGLKETLLAWFQMQIRVRKSDVNRAHIFCRKNFKAEESLTFQSIFSSMAHFRDVVSVLPAARLIKASRIFVALQKANRP